VLVAWRLLVRAKGLGARIYASLDQRLSQRLGEGVVGGRMAYEECHSHARTRVLSFSHWQLVPGRL